MNYIGENIKKIRLRKKMTIAQVANQHISAGMISMIENGKTQPSIERLQHIAKNLGVGIGELLGRYSRSDLRNHIKGFEENIRGANATIIKDHLEKMNKLFPYLDEHYEAARIHELYARHTYMLFAYHHDAYERLTNKDWQSHANLAIELYAKLQMDWCVLEMYAFLADVQLMFANYGEVIELTEQAIEDFFTEEEPVTQRAYIKLLNVKIVALIAQGKADEAMRILNEAITYMKENLIMDQFYPLHNIKALLLYNDDQIVEARKVVKIMGEFIALIEHSSLWFEFQMINIHMSEFFEGEIEHALDIITTLEEELKDFQAIGFSKEAYENVHIYLQNAKARCYTKLNKYEEAIYLFERFQFKAFENITFVFLDTSIRVISKSYLAKCYLALGEKVQAESLAKSVVKQLSAFPHTAYYHFARETLREVRK